VSGLPATNYPFYYAFPGFIFSCPSELRTAEPEGH